MQVFIKHYLMLMSAIRQCFFHAVCIVDNEKTALNHEVFLWKSY